MSDNTNQSGALEGGTYEIIRNRLQTQANDLTERLQQLNDARKVVFGSIETTLIATERITTANNCLPRDMVSLGKEVMLFGYNVHIGLRTEITIQDVFGCYQFDNKSHTFSDLGLERFNDEAFLEDFANLYKYYRETVFVKFAELNNHLYMVFQIGKRITDIKTFKWSVKNGKVKYLGNRSESEYIYPDQHEFKWKRTNRDMQRSGTYPHISIEDKVFVETLNGDLTIKIEDNTDSGKGIYHEPVEQPDQTLDDCEVSYAMIGNLIALKIRPYKENEYRYIVYNTKIQEAIRLDALADSCVLLPEDHGLIFPKGYYLQTGEYKLFDSQLEGMLYERKIASPNGEDYLYIFYNQASGSYILLSYNLIQQSVKTPIICNGFSIFEDGELCYFKTEQEQKKHHAVQIWQTPYLDPNMVAKQKESDSYLFKIGNKDIVRTMAECREVIKLVSKNDSFNNLYLDITKKTTDILDTNHWLAHKEAFNIEIPLKSLKQTASNAIDEFEKVKSVKQSTKEQVDLISEKTNQTLKETKHFRGKNIEAYVDALSALRKSRGEIASLKELRYVDLEVIEILEQEVVEHTNEVSKNCVSFLVRPESLSIYEEKIEEYQQKIETLTKTFEAKIIEEEILDQAKKLEMLIDVVSNLKIEDVTQTTKIIDQISEVYSKFNAVSADLKTKKKSLLMLEGKAEFSAQLKLTSQSVVNFLDLSTTPEKCEEYLNKLMVQLEELESKFIDFEEFLNQITLKREEIYEAFENKKVYLQEQRNKRANGLMDGATRIIKSAKNKLASFKNEEEIHSYFASDIMIEKVRNQIESLLELGETVKSDDLASQLKALKEDAVRSLKDKKELFSDGDNIITFGSHKFLTNTQKLALTLVQKSDGMYYHLTGTDFFKKIKDEDLNKHQAIWNNALVSENNQVYRGAYLAYLIYSELDNVLLESQTDDELLATVQTFMAPRYTDNYIKGIHDFDTVKVLRALLKQNHFNKNVLENEEVRAISKLAWFSLSAEKTEELNAVISMNKVLNEVFQSSTFDRLSEELHTVFESILPEEYHIHLEKIVNYIAKEKIEYDSFSISQQASELYLKLKEKIKTDAFKLLNDFKHQKDIFLKYEFIYGAIKHFNESNLHEVAALLASEDYNKKDVVQNVEIQKIEELKGDHPKVKDGNYLLDYAEFKNEIEIFRTDYQPAYNELQTVKKKLIEKYEKELRLSEFEPKIMSSFVRNQLIDKVYLPIVGDNLAKQIGATGVNKRTDLMGMLLLISPPGYGKTTLMEYIANRLGLIFMKINGPAIGHTVTGLDPKQADSTAAAEELEKLNLAFEMGDNVMIYLDDIQHCSPEFLQKFISLCDAQRKIEGVFEGEPKTYDFKGKKVAVIMAGNPYTESGDKFQIPDMLANRADIYNLGDIIGGKSDAFEMSYVENSLSSHPILNQLKNKHYKDVFEFIKLAEGQDKEVVNFEGQYSAQVIEEYISLFKKMLRVKEVVFEVNQLYIESAGQEDNYRVEPPFKLQGSYRNMNKLVEKLDALMNDEELTTLILSHYENESQTLTTGSEANMLKFKSLTNLLTNEEGIRWSNIKEEFLKRQKMKGYGDDSSAQVIVQLQSIADNLQQLKPGEALLDGKKVDIQIESLIEGVRAISTVLLNGEELQDLKEKNKKS